VSNILGETFPENGNFFKKPLRRALQNEGGRKIKIFSGEMGISIDAAIKT